MMFIGGRFKARLAETQEDVRACQRLRFVAFMQSRGLMGDGTGLDTDEFDPHCRHMMVEDTRTGSLVCCFRMMPLSNGSEILRSYSAKYYDLNALGDYPGKMVEMGRFCIHPESRDPAIIRVAWQAMTRFVDDEGVELLFGCSSFHGVDEDAYMDAFALLKEKHLAPKRWLPRVKAPDVFRFAARLRRKPDAKKAMARMPPLLRTYLLMGGWVSDHAVLDPDLDRLHVFTGLATDTIPETRKARLRALAKAAQITSS